MKEEPLQLISLSVLSNSCSCGCISDRPIHIATVAASVSGSKSGEEASAMGEGIERREKGRVE